MAYVFYIIVTLSGAFTTLCLLFLGDILEHRRKMRSKDVELQALKTEEAREKRRTAELERGLVTDRPHES